MKDRQAREAGAAHAIDGLAHGGVVLDEHHVDARRHHLACHRVSQVKDLMDHALLLVEKRVLLGHQVLDLILGDLGAVVGRLEAQEPGHALGGVGEQRHDGGGDLLGHLNGTGHALGVALGVGQGYALGDQLADDEGHVRHDEGDHHHGDGARARGKPANSQAGQPPAKAVGQGGSGKGGGAKAGQGDEDLDG